MTESSSGPTGPGSVLLDIGGEVGALIIITPARMAGEEIHVSPLPDPARRTHALVRERRLGAASCHAAVYPALPGRGLHDLAGRGPARPGPSASTAEPPPATAGRSPAEPAGGLHRWPPWPGQTEPGPVRREMCRCVPVPGLLTP